MLELNVKETCKASYFRKVMSKDGNESVLHDVAARILQQFISQKQKGVEFPVPNLRSNITISEKSICKS